MSRKTPKSLFRGRASIRCATLAPNGANMKVIGIISKNAGIFIAPNVQGKIGASTFTNAHKKAEGTAIARPNPAAVATAR